MEQCGKMEIRDVVAEEFMICFLSMPMGNLSSNGTQRLVWKEHSLRKKIEIAADGFVLSNLGFSGNLGDSLRIGEKGILLLVF